MQIQVPARKIIVIQIISLIVLGFLVYANTLGGKFLWDDYGLVRDNAHIQSLSNIKKIFVTDIGAGADVKSNFYRPVQILTYALDYSLWQLNPAGYRLTSILLHIAVALCAYWLVNLIFQNYWLAFLSAIFFAVHPIHTEAVAYISARADIIAALFFLLTFIFYIKHVNSGSNKPLALALLFYPLALFAKENSLILPALVVFYHYVFRSRLKTRALLFLLIEAVGYLLLRLAVLKSQPLVLSYNNEFLHARLPGFFLATGEYIRLIFLPFNLHMEYGLKIFKFSDPGVIAGALMLIAALLCVFKKWKNKIWPFAAGWFLITLFPASNIYPVNAYMAEHWMYLPSVGVFIAVSYAIISLHKLQYGRILAKILIILLVFYYAYLAARQNNYWRSPLLLLERTLKYAPDSPRVNNELGNEYAGLGDTQRALAFYQQAIMLGPRYKPAYIGLGNFYLRMDKPAEALAVYQRAAGLFPDSPQPYVGAGNALLKLKKGAEAIKWYEKAIALQPDAAYIYHNIAVAHFSLKEYALAVKYFDTAMKLGYQENPKLEESLKPYRRRSE
ncbi:MAG: tetratricopeptide repeat protein [Candidatus Omnitrophica bacterium]|nr:tetratricopeptide repeat protein [Candidatus Omnitrophota bacterium]